MTKVDGPQSERFNESRRFWVRVDGLLSQSGRSWTIVGGLFELMWTVLDQSERGSNWTVQSICIEKNSRKMFLGMGSNSVIYI